jgi:6-phosphogluconolactonase/glucosamine-6-phosphate isomerase/deaminase
MPASRSLIVVSDAAALAETALARLVEPMVKSEREIAVCLTGGTTPKHMYAMMHSRRGANAFRGIAYIGSWETIASCLIATR